MKQDCLAVLDTNDTVLIQIIISYHSKERKPPLPLYLGLNIHTQTRSKKLVNKLSKLGLCISYDRVLELENVGLTENPSAFRRWMVAGPKQAHLLQEFKSQFMDNANHNCLQHEESCSTQTTFTRQVNSLC